MKSLHISRPSMKGKISNKLWNSIDMVMPRSLSGVRLFSLRPGDSYREFIESRILSGELTEEQIQARISRRAYKDRMHRVRIGEASEEDLGEG